MIREVSDADVLAFMRAGCNAEELAAFAGCTIEFAAGWMAHAAKHADYSSVTYPCALQLELHACP